jgi:hypothetical protein
MNKDGPGVIDLTIVKSTKPSKNQPHHPQKNPHIPQPVDERPDQKALVRSIESVKRKRKSNLWGILNGLRHSAGMREVRERERKFGDSCWLV